MLDSEIFLLPRLYSTALMKLKNQSHPNLVMEKDHL